MRKFSRQKRERVIVKLPPTLTNPERTGNLPEPTTKALSDQIVLGLYARLINRSPSEKERLYWVSFLENTSFTETYDAFITTKEYGIRHVLPGHPVGHYYSPVVDPRTIDRSLLRGEMNASDLAIAGLSLPRMLTFWHDHKAVISQARFSLEPSPENRFHLANPVFSFADAIMLRAMMLIYKPRRIIEIGSGYSSAVMLDTAEEAGMNTDFTFIDPFPQRLANLLRPSDSVTTDIIESPVQSVDLALFDKLEANDILFIDSTHVLKTQSDVCREFFDILPRLKAGVIIHFHDIFYPFEYPDSWIFDRRYSWNEVYGLRLFLMHNTHYETIFFNNMFGKLAAETVAASCPLFLENIGGSFWLRKVQV
jgi:predicted O-methyltransferase YrrM